MIHDVQLTFPVTVLYMYFPLRCRLADAPHMHRIAVHHCHRYNLRHQVGKSTSSYVR